MRRQALVWMAAAAITTGLHASAAAAQPEVHELNTPFAATMFNACTGEMVAVEGTMNLLVQITADESGGFHNKVHLSSKGEGIGAVSGTRYVYSEESNSELSLPGQSNAATVSQEINHFVTSASPTDNYFLKVTFHLTFNGLGVPTAFVDKFELGCRG